MKVICNHKSSCTDIWCTHKELHSYDGSCRLPCYNNKNSDCINCHCIDPMKDQLNKDRKNKINKINKI